MRARQILTITEEAAIAVLEAEFGAESTRELIRSFRFYRNVDVLDAASTRDQSVGCLSMM